MTNLPPEIRRVYQREYLRINRQLVWGYLLEHPCVDCGEPDPVVLEFDHRDPTDKHRHVAKMLGGTTSWSTILKEIGKCDVRCANCHRRKTALQFNHYQGLDK